MSPWVRLWGCWGRALGRRGGGTPQPAGFAAAKAAGNPKAGQMQTRAPAHPRVLGSESVFVGDTGILVLGAEVRDRVGRRVRLWCGRDHLKKAPALLTDTATSSVGLPESLVL